MELFVFNQRVKHGKLDFHPGVVYGFEDSDAAPYFTACGWGKTVADDTDAPVVRIGLAEIDIDPDTLLMTGQFSGRKLSEVLTNG